VFRLPVKTKPADPTVTVAAQVFVPPAFETVRVYFVVRTGFTLVEPPAGLTAPTPLSIVAVVGLPVVVQLTVELPPAVILDGDADRVQLIHRFLGVNNASATFNVPALVSILGESTLYEVGTELKLVPMVGLTDDHSEQAVILVILPLASVLIRRMSLPLVPALVVDAATM